LVFTNSRPPKVECKNTLSGVVQSYVLSAAQIHHILTQGEEKGVATALEVIKKEESFTLKQPEIKSSHSLYIIIQEHQKFRYYKFTNFTIKLSGKFNQIFHVPFSQLHPFLYLSSLNCLVSEVSKKIEWNIDSLSNPNFLDFSRNALFTKSKNNYYNNTHPDYFAKHFFTGTNQSFNIEIEYP